MHLLYMGVGQTYVNIDSNYVDGISLTHGNNPRRHIWTFAVAFNDELSLPRTYQCVRPGNRSIMAPPSFMGMDYFCDTGNRRAVLFSLVIPCGTGLGVLLLAHAVPSIIPCGSTSNSHQPPLTI